MKAHYNNKKQVKMFKKGDTVSPRIPRIDWAASDLHRLPCVVIERLGTKQVLYRLQCEHGVINTCYPGGELEAHTGSVNIKNCTSASRVGVREAAKKMNPFNSYYGTFCSCKGDCSGKKCSCQLAHKPCSARCHSGRSCLNHHDELITHQHHSSIPTDSSPPPSHINAHRKRAAEPTSTETEAPPPSSSTQTEDLPTSWLEQSKPVDVDRLLTPPPTLWWVKEFSLKEQDRTALNNGEWLNDLHISAAQQLLQTYFPKVGSLQSSLLGVNLKFEPVKSGSVQILYFSCHWACVSTVGCDPGHVNVYDSLFLVPPTPLVQQLCCLLRTNESQIMVNMMEMQSQSGGVDCGCFAIACATALCHGQNPSSMVWSQTRMREYLANCLTNKTLTPFPGKKTTSQRKTWIKKTLTYPLFCSCRGPADRKGMLRCVKCLEWFHRRCANIPSSAFKKNVVWTCPSCH